MMPIPFRLVGLLLLGALIGAAINAVACLFGERVRRYSPWLAPEPKAPPRTWDDRIPIVGWLGLRREAAIHGRAFWLRPMLVELAMALALPALYWWEVVEHGLMLMYVEPPSTAVLHLHFLAHAVLLTFLLAGSLIDLDDQIIPDAVTVPGTLLGLALALCLPWSMLPIADPVAEQQFEQRVAVDPGAVWPESLPASWLSLAAPNPWPRSLDAPRVDALGLALACWWGWCLALLPHTWYARRGVIRALRLSIARRLHRANRWLWGLALLGSAVVLVAWWIGGEHWRGLLTALVGMAGGGVMIWAVRLVGRFALQKEAMGFGDVTLMAMIGAFLGWQTSLLIFFCAPLAGVVLGIIQWVARSETAMPYGPFLALAAAAVVLRWPAFWDWTWPAFSFGWLVPVGFAVCIALMAVMLLGWRVISDLLLGRVEE